MYFNSNIKCKGQFSLVATDYDSARPVYPEIVYKEAIKAMRKHGLKKTKLENVLEIGGGSGQATERLSKLAYHLDCIEPGKAFANILRQRFRSFKNIKVFKATFEEFESSREYDLVASACAIHWIPKRFFYRRIRSILKPGGWVLGIWHQPTFSDSVYKIIGEVIKPRFPKFWIPQNTRENQKLFEIGFREFSRKQSFINCRRKTYFQRRFLTADVCAALIWSYVDISGLTRSEKNHMRKSLQQRLQKLSAPELVVRDYFPVAMGQNTE